MVYNAIIQAARDISSSVFYGVPHDKRSPPFISSYHNESRSRGASSTYTHQALVDLGNLSELLAESPDVMDAPSAVPLAWAHGGGGLDVEASVVTRSDMYASGSRLFPASVSSSSHRRPRRRGDLIMARGV